MRPGESVHFVGFDSQAGLISVLANGSMHGFGELMLLREMHSAQNARPGCLTVYVLAIRFSIQHEQAKSSVDEAGVCRVLTQWEGRVWASS